MTLPNKWKLENIPSGYHISSSQNSDKHQTQNKTLPEEHVSRPLVPEHKRPNERTNEQTNKEKEKKCIVLRWKIKIKKKKCTTRLEHYSRYGLCNVDVTVPTCTHYVLQFYQGTSFCIGHQAFMHMKPGPVLKSCMIFRKKNYFPPHGMARSHWKQVGVREGQV